MPRSFYPDMYDKPEGSESCQARTEMWDGPAYCNRPKGHKIEAIESDNLGTGEFHQEAFEGWIWDDRGFAQ